MKARDAVKANAIAVKIADRLAAMLAARKLAATAKARGLRVLAWRSGCVKNATRSRRGAYRDAGGDLGGESRG